MVLRHKATNSNRHPEALGAHLCAPSLEGVTAPIRAASFEARAQSVAGLVIVILARGHLRMTARDRATAEICDAVQLAVQVGCMQPTCYGVTHHGADGTHDACVIRGLRAVT